MAPSDDALRRVTDSIRRTTPAEDRRNAISAMELGIEEGREDLIECAAHIMGWRWVNAELRSRGRHEFIINSDM